MKDPAFLFYPNDWMGGTMYMTHEQKGCYIDLLILQFNIGKFTEAQAKQVLSICFDLAWPIVKLKFINEGEYYYNERLRLEIEKRKKFTESRRANASQPKKETQKKEASAEHILEHMEDENRNRNIDYNSIIELYNKICISLPKVEKISNSRKNKIKARYDDLNSIAKWNDLFILVEKSDFLTGKKTEWKASFDWIVENDKNYLKVLEGNYSNKNEPAKVSTNLSNHYYQSGLKEEYR